MNTEAKETLADHLLTAKEVLAALNISDGTLRRGIASGRLPAAIDLTPGCKRWRASDIEAVMSGNWPRPDSLDNTTGGTA